MKVRLHEALLNKPRDFTQRDGGGYALLGDERKQAAVDSASHVQLQIGQKGKRLWSELDSERAVGDLVRSYTLYNSYAEEEALFIRSLLNPKP